MTAAKNVYALMLALIIVLSGCFGATTDDSDAQDSGSDENDHGDEDDQERIWYTSGGVYLTSWNMDGVDSQGEYCSDWEETYSSQTGELIDRHCLSLIHI